MNTLSRIPAVFVFEWRRALTVPRLAWMVALAAFPPVLLLMIRLAARRDPPFEASAIVVYILSPCLACMMSVFLWATPAISSELEGRSWVYLAVRPHGPLSVILGKYLVAVSWAIPVGLVSSILGSVIMGPADRVMRLISVECSLVILSCLAYAAVFLLIGVIIPRRAMVVGVVYTIAIEVGAAFIPAAVNLLTIQHRLRCVLVRGMDLKESLAENNPVFLSYFGTESSLWHVGVLLLMTALYLTAAALLLQFREFTAAAETET